MRVTFDCEPAYTIAYCHLSEGEAVDVERGSMAAMSHGISPAAGTGPGGIGKAIKRKAFGREGLLMSRYIANLEDAWVAIAPRYPGDVAQIECDSGGPGICLEQGAYLASSGQITLDTRWAGLRNIVMREGATMLHLTGDGLALVSSYGGLQTFSLEDGQEMIVDSGHLVAYSDDLKIRAGTLGGVPTSITTGEGLVANFTGPGRIWMQTRAEQHLESWLFPHRAQNEGRR